MTQKTFIICVADVPAELHQAWLQHMRDFDTAHPGCHFVVSVHSPTSTVEEMLKVIELDPPLPHKLVIKKP